MKREIKFRGWNMMGNEPMFYTLHPSIKNKPNWNSDFWNKVDADPDSYEVMQFTGLLDKHGKEIYECDILIPSKNTGYKEPPEGLKCQVVWSKDEVSFRGLKDNKQDEEYILNKFTAEKHWEVIGNIYENPELLAPNNK